MKDDGNLEVGGEKYLRLTLQEQIRLRPETYIGAHQGIIKDHEWIAYDEDGIISVERKLISTCSAIVGICKEPFDNATDNVERSRADGLDPESIDVTLDNDVITIKNYGKGIAIEQHHTENIPVPQMIFGVLLTSDNYDDSVDKYKGGRNGYGIKLTNIFSNWFKVTIEDPVNQIKYEQEWEDGMKIIHEPIMTKYKGKNASTEISFRPDFKYFYDSPKAKDEFLDDMWSYFLCKTLQVSYSCNIPVSFNGIQYDYGEIKDFFALHMKLSRDTNTETWKSKDGYTEFMIADTPKKGFAIGFINGMSVHEGEHINAYLKAIFADVISEWKKTHQKTVTVKHIKPHVSIIIKCRVPNPTFDSQVKKRFVKSKPNIKAVVPNSIVKRAAKWNLVEELKAHFDMKTPKATEERQKRITGLKVIEAQKAGTVSGSKDCILLVTEGESAATLADRGRKFFPGGYEYIGIYPLRGKVINIRRHSEEKVANNKELRGIAQIMGLDPKLDYTNESAMKTLRYGRIGILADADDDGYHIAALIINFFFTTFRTLAPKDFVFMVHTPVCEVKLPGEDLISFYLHKQFMHWSGELDKPLTKKQVSYYKGLGSWDSDDKILKRLFKEPYLATMTVDHMTEEALSVAFDRERVEDRKAWISSYQYDPEYFIPEFRSVTDFYNEELRCYSLESLNRAIPSVWDGFKDVGRRIIYTGLIKGKASKTKVPVFGGHVMSETSYHHGELSLYESIIGMGFNWLTSGNNIPLFIGAGNFGSRRLRGQDSSAARYLKISIRPITKLIFRKEDLPILEPIYDEGDMVGYKYFLPIICMSLINKIEGIGSGWSTKIYPHDPRVIIEWQENWIREHLAKRDSPDADFNHIDLTTKPELIPWYRDYTGTIFRIQNEPYEVFENQGTFVQTGHVVTVTEVPVETKLQTYNDWLAKEQEIYNDPLNHEKPAEGEDPRPVPILRSFKAADITRNPNFTIYGMGNPTLKKLKLVRNLRMSNMVLLNNEGKPKKFSYTYEILTEFCFLRLEKYEERRLHTIKSLEENLIYINKKYLFCKDIVEERLEIRNVPIAQVYEYMDHPDREYPREFADMALKSITKEILKKLKQQIEEIKAQLEYFKNVYPEQIWLDELQELKPILDNVLKERTK